MNQRQIGWTLASVLLVALIAIAYFLGVGEFVNMHILDWRLWVALYCATVVALCIESKRVNPDKFLTALFLTPFLPCLLGFGIFVMVMHCLEMTSKAPYGEKNIVENE
jgi:hypothetical protein